MTGTWRTPVRVIRALRLSTESAGVQYHLGRHDLRDRQVEQSDAEFCSLRTTSAPDDADEPARSDHHHRPDVVRDESLDSSPTVMSGPTVETVPPLSSTRLRSHPDASLVTWLTSKSPPKYAPLTAKEQILAERLTRL